MTMGGIGGLLRTSSSSTVIIIIILLLSSLLLLEAGPDGASLAGALLPTLGAAESGKSHASAASCSDSAQIKNTKIKSTDIYWQNTDVNKDHRFESC